MYVWLGLLGLVVGGFGTIIGAGGGFLLMPILAALYPAKHNFLYFVADNNGHHRFARNYEEHQQNVRLYRKARQLERLGVQ